METLEIIENAGICPRCGKNTMREPQALNALSRRDNKTYICSPCGAEEAFFDYDISCLPPDADSKRIERLKARECLWLTVEKLHRDKD